MTKPIPMGRDNPDDDFVIGFMCLIDFECEIGMADGGNTVYASIDDCRKSRKCVASCGIVEVEVRARKIVQEPIDELRDGWSTLTSAESTPNE